MIGDAWDPLKELASVQQRMNRLFESALTGPSFDPEAAVGGWTPVADVFQTSHEWTACLEIPGLTRDEIQIRVERDTLVVSGEARLDRERPGEQYHRVERSHGAFVRRLPLPAEFDAEKVSAAYRDGVLTVRAPRRTDADQPPIRVSVD